MFACFTPAKEVAEALKEEFGLDLQPFQLYPWDADRPAGKDLPEEYVALFRETRAKYRESVQDVAIANRVWRMKEYQKMYDRATGELTHKSNGKHDPKLKNDNFALKILEQVAKETGGTYSRMIQVDHQHTHAGVNGTPLAPQIVVQFAPSPAMPDPQKAFLLAAAKPEKADETDVIDVELA